MEREVACLNDHVELDIIIIIQLHIVIQSVQNSTHTIFLKYKSKKKMH